MSAITNVEETADPYTVNVTIDGMVKAVPRVRGNSVYRRVIEWLRDGNSIDTFPFSLAEYKTERTHDLDQGAALIRTFAMTRTAGQSLVYKQKQDEATVFEVDAAPSAEKYPHIYAEAEATGRTPAEMAAVYRAKAAEAAKLSAKIEAARIKAKAAIRAATTKEEIDAAAAVDWDAVLG